MVAAFAGEELLDLVRVRVDVAQEREVVLARALDHAGAGDVLGDVATHGDGHDPVARAVEHQGRNRDERQQMPHVVVEAALHERLRLSGARRAELELREPFAERRVSDARTHEVEERARTPTLTDRRREPPQHSRRQSDGIVVGDGEARPRREQHERFDTIGMSDREHDRDRGPARDAEARRPVDPRRVEHGQHVIDALLECRQIRERNWVGHPRAALVHQHDPGERRDPALARADDRILDPEAQVRHRADDAHDVRRPDAQLGVCQVQPFPGPCVTDLGCVRHEIDPTGCPCSVKSVTPPRRHP